MDVNLVGKSVPVIDGITDAEALLVYMARVSNPESQQAGDNPERLLAYLVRHKHWSPFEMVSLTIQIEASRDISRQILRHRSFSFQEFSQRPDYAAGCGEVRGDPGGKIGERPDSGCLV